MERGLRLDELPTAVERTRKVAMLELGTAVEWPQESGTGVESSAEPRPGLGSAAEEAAEDLTKLKPTRLRTSP